MKIKNYISLLLFSLMLISPVISLTIKSVVAEDSISSTQEIIDSVIFRDSPVKLVYRVDIEGAIGTVTDERIAEAIELSEEEKAELLIITLDTPGGFTRPTWSICKNILNSEVPVCMYISPSGAKSGSAGVYMTYSAHFAAMAPSTNIGSAHPVGGGGQEIDSIMNEKITNDAVAQIKAAAEKWGRNKEWAEKAVRESVNITDNEALELNVIDLRADNIDDLLDKLDGRTISTTSGEKTLALKNTRVETIEKTFVQALLEIITQPDIAFILMSIGGLGILLELYNPGSIFPGVVGAICLIMAFYSFQTLPINYAGVAFLLLGVILFIAEIKVVSHGLLTIGGLISVFFGGLMLIDTVDPNLQISISVLVSVVLIAGIVLALVLYLVVKATRNRVTTGNEGMMGKLAEVRENGMVYVDGALWKAEADGPLFPGEQVEIIGLDKLKLKVKKILK